MRILVTGGTGFIGQHLVRALVAQPDTAVTLFLREAYSHIDISPLPLALQAIRSQFDVVYADLRNFQQTVRAVRAAAPDQIVHLAAAGVTEPFLEVETAVRHNLTGTVNLVRAAFEKNHTTQQLLVSRTPGERTQMNVYATSKLAAWNFCQMYARTQQWPIVGAMIFQAYGLGQHERSLLPSAMRAALAGQDFPMTSGEQARDWIDVGDVVGGLQAALAADLSPGSSVDLGTGQATSVADVVRLVYALAERGGRPLIGTLPSRPGETAVQLANVTQTKQMIGWETAVGLREGLQRTLAQLATR